MTSRHQLWDFAWAILERRYHLRILDGVTAVEKAESVATGDPVELINLNWYGGLMATGPWASSDPCPGDWSWP